MKVLSSEQIKSLEKKCFETGLSSQLVMENAGRSVVLQIKENFPDIKKATIFCGSGNNGGDGFVIARVLSDIGVEVELILVGDKAKFSKETALNYELIKDSHFVNEVSFNSELIVDALLGTGSKGAARSQILESIKYINQFSEKHNIPILAVDLPSGICPDTGAVGLDAINADLTVAFQYPKWGNLNYTKNGTVIVANIGLGNTTLGTELLDYYNFPSIAFQNNIHKGSKGHLLIVGGAIGKNGSVKLAALAALKTASGLSTIAVPEDQLLAVSNSILEVMSSSLPSNGKGEFSNNIEENTILELLKNKDAVVIGPGMGLECDILLEKIISCTKKQNLQVVLDADALTILSNLKIKLNSNFVLTPHPGEMARLLDSDISTIQSDRRKFVKELSAKFSCWSILKGAQTLISDPEGNLAICSYSCPALATAGSGDVLAGVIGSLLGAGLETKDAIYSAVYAHACAGLLLEDAQLGVLGSSASDIYDIIPIILNSFPKSRTSGFFSVLGEQAFLDTFLIDFE